MLRKRERNANFTREEIVSLVSLVEAHKDTVENKKSDAVTWQEKEKAWKNIEIDFNSSGNGPFRDAKHLKMKYDAIKKMTRKKCSVVRADLYKAGGGPNATFPLTEAEKKIKEMILLSVEGQDSTCDSDQLKIKEGITFNEGTVLFEPNNVEVICLDEPNSSRQHSDINNLEERSVSSFNSPLITMKEDDTKINTRSQWKPSQAKEYLAICPPKEKRILSIRETKLELVELQRAALEEELKEKKYKTKILEEAEKRKKEIHDLEKKMLENEILHKMSMQNLIMEQEKKKYALKEKALMMKIEILEANRNNNVCVCKK